MKNKMNYVLAAICIVSALLLSCSKRESDKKLPALELSFSKTLDEVPLSYLSTLIGKGNGDTETFGEKRSLVVFYGIEDCNTCEQTKPVVEKWVKENGYKVYYYNSDTGGGSESEKEELLKKLGSEDGVALTAGRLIVFVN